MQGRSFCPVRKAQLKNRVESEIDDARRRAPRPGSRAISVRRGPALWPISMPRNDSRDVGPGRGRPPPTGRQRSAVDDAADIPATAAPILARAPPASAGKSRDHLAILRGDLAWRVPPIELLHHSQSALCSGLEMLSRASRARRWIITSCDWNAARHGVDLQCSSCYCC